MYAQVVVDRCPKCGAEIVDHEKIRDDKEWERTFKQSHCIPCGNRFDLISILNSVQPEISLPNNRIQAQGYRKEKRGIIRELARQAEEQGDEDTDY